MLARPEPSVRHSAGFVVGVLAIGALVGCTSSVPLAESRVGMSLAAESPVGEIVYDLSFPILGLEAAFNGGSARGLWTVVADCTADDRHAFSVIPSSNASSELIGKASTGEFDNLLVECS